MRSDDTSTDHSSGSSTHPPRSDRAAALRELALLRKEHRVDSSGRLRAAVLGANDGLVSNVSLVMAMAGAAPPPGVVLLAGLAGIVAGAISMAIGEYVSVRIQREQFETLIALERRELAIDPEHEAHEITVIYRAKGIPRADAERLAAHLMLEPDAVVDLMAREELGLNPDELGSPYGVAISSFLAFAAGAAVPVVPFTVLPVEAAAPAAAALTIAALLATGAYTAFMSGKSIVRGALRLAALGGTAAIITHLAGRAVGGVGLLP